MAKRIWETDYVSIDCYRNEELNRIFLLPYEQFVDYLQDFMATFDYIVVHPKDTFHNQLELFNND